MKTLIHPAYLRELLGELEESTYGDDLVQPHGFVRPSRFGALTMRLSDARYRLFGAGVGLGIVGTLLLVLPLRSTSSHEVPVLQNVVHESPPQGEAISASTKLESEMALMKRIVAGLVESVQSLSKAQKFEKATLDESEPFPFPVQVTAHRAHLRKGADLTAPSLIEVTKDTTLMAFAGTDKWLKVSTPRGEDAWISRSVVVEKRG
jgi:hypothetical protein